MICFAKNFGIYIFFIMGLTSSLFSQENDEEVNSSILMIDLERGINIALQSQRTMGSALNALDQSITNLQLEESEFFVRIVPKADVGYIGGGRAGDGISVGGGVDFSKRFSNGTIVSIIPTIMKAAHNYQSSLRFVFTQPLLRGFGKEYAYDGIYCAQFSNRLAVRNVYLAKINLILQTIQLMYEITLNENMLTLSEDSLSRVKNFYTATKLKQKIGIGDTLNVYRAETELKRAEDQLNNSMDSFQDAKDNLRDLLGMPTDLAFEVELPIEYTPPTASYDEFLKIALNNRIEIGMAEDQARENKRLERIAKNNLKPELNLVMDYTSNGYNEILTRSWTGRRENKWGVGFSTTTDFNNLAVQAAYQQSIKATCDAEMYISQVKDNIALEVKRGLRFLKRAEQKILNQKEQIHNATKEYKFASLKFEHGIADNFDLIQAENNLRQAQIALLSAVIDHKIGEYRFLATIGTLADKPDICR